MNKKGTSRAIVTGILFIIATAVVLINPMNASAGRVMLDQHANFDPYSSAPFITGTSIAQSFIAGYDGILTQIGNIYWSEGTQLTSVEIREGADPSAGKVIGVSTKTECVTYSQLDGSCKFFFSSPEVELKEEQVYTMVFNASSEEIGLRRHPKPNLDPYSRGNLLRDGVATNYDILFRTYLYGEDTLMEVIHDDSEFHVSDGGVVELGNIAVGDLLSETFTIALVGGSELTLAINTIESTTLSTDSIVLNTPTLPANIEDRQEVDFIDFDLNITPNSIGEKQVVITISSTILNYGSDLPSGEYIFTVRYTSVGSQEEPTATDDNIEVDEDTATVVNVLENDTYVAFGEIRIDSTPTNGVVTVNGETVNYTSSVNYYGTDSFTYQIVDNQGQISNVATVTVTVNDAPVVNDDEEDDSKSEEETEVLGVDGSDTDEVESDEEILAATGSNLTMPMILGLFSVMQAVVVTKRKKK